MLFVRRDAKKSLIKPLPDMHKKNIIILSILALIFALSILFLVVTSLQKNTEKDAQSPLRAFSKQNVSVDDDPILGEDNAPLTLIEFSDFECGNCKLFFLQTLPLIKKNYIDTGKLKLVYRDFPTQSHDPLATEEAMAAACAREQRQDPGYFEYHDEIFNTTRSGGRGLEGSELFLIADKLKLDPKRFKECFESGRFREEVKKDFYDGMNNGVTGTPTFFFGLSSKGDTIEGMKITGAIPYAAFKIIIEELLASIEEGR